MKEYQTEAAPAARSSATEISADHDRLSTSEYIRQIADATNTLFLILNENRQIVFANKKIIELFESDADSLMGDRPGEILNCINSRKNPAGCGTHKFCNQCGALRAIIDALEGKKSLQECRISSVIDNETVASDLSVSAAPFHYMERTYVIFSVVDISNQKRKEVLERVFFHDILNTAGGLTGFSQLLKSELENTEHYENAEILYDISDKLVQEIKSQRMLMAAENGKLEINISEIQLSTFISSVLYILKENEAVKQTRLVFSQKGGDFVFKSDSVILQRILVNMIKNAAEASRPGDEVTVGSKKEGEYLTFFVHNKTVMSDEVKAQIFQRSFSTKGPARGIGTYSMKLFVENYLKGNIRFESEPGKGTTFYVEIKG